MAVRVWRPGCSRGSSHPSRRLTEKELQMANQNYAFAKRQRDLAKKQKKEEKRQRKMDAQLQPPAQDASPQPAVEEATVIRGESDV